MSLTKFQTLLWSPLLFVLFTAQEVYADLYVYKDSNGSIYVNHTPMRRQGNHLISTYRSPTRPRGDFSRDLDNYQEEIRRASHEFGVDESLIRAVIKAESDFDPYAVSVAGALGLMQLMPQTAERMGVIDAFNPAENIYGGVRYLSKLKEMFSDTKLAVAAYHAGENRVARYGDVPPIPATLEYVDRVLHFYEKFKKVAKPTNTIFKVVLPNGETLYTTSMGEGERKGIIFQVD